MSEAIEVTPGQKPVFNSILRLRKGLLKKAKMDLWAKYHKDLMELDPLPTMQEVGDDCGMTRAGVWFHVRGLIERKALVPLKGRSRGLKPVAGVRVVLERKK